MKAAAITNSGSDIRVEEFIESITTWVMPISGWPETKNSTAAQAPSTRKIGMPEASRPKNITKKRADHILDQSLGVISSCSAVWPMVMVSGSKAKT